MQIAKGLCSRRFGWTLGHLGHEITVPATIQLRSLKADDVPVAVPTDAKQTLIDGTDGLLGMSFLSRFRVSIDAQSVTVSGRESK